MRQWAAALTRISLPILRIMSPEFAHDLALAGAKCLRPLWAADDVPAGLRLHCLGLSFAHPVGLAAGFDKNGDYLDALGAMGFSHIELGTVTPRPQPGNTKPRMFRFPAAQALVNRMGFNNKGAAHLVAQLKRSRYRGIRGISIGKNFDTPLDRSQDDYVACMRTVYEHADYIAVNVSSPNTVGLRELQGRDGLTRITGALLEERVRLRARHGKTVPVLVKVAPDLTAEQISALAVNLRAAQIDGVIATNTSMNLCEFTPPAQPGGPGRSGGLSGEPLHRLSMAVIAQLRRELGADFPIIGVGGIVSAEHALASLRAGANLIQIYTGFAYRGQPLLEEILGALARQS
jgi:dihydroorotate dehydrogenase